MRGPSGLHQTVFYEARCTDCGIRSGLSETEHLTQNRALAADWFRDPNAEDAWWFCPTCKEKPGREVKP